MTIRENEAFIYIERKYILRTPSRKTIDISLEGFTVIGVEHLMKELKVVGKKKEFARENIL